MTAPPPIQEDSPYAAITRTGLWTYSVDIIHGLTGFNCLLTAFGRRHAERLARRKLARYMRRESRRERWTVNQRQL